MNPVLREGNSDRRAPTAVKEYAQEASALDGRVVAGLEDPRRPHEARRLLLATRSRSTLAAGRRPADRARRPRTATVTVLKESVPVLAGEVVDAHRHEPQARCVAFLRGARSTMPRSQGVLFSLHLKATMMKVSDPIIFGHAVTRLLQGRLRQARRRRSKRVGVDPNNGFGDLLAKIADAARRASAAAIEADIEAVYAARPALAMVNSDKGITNLHVPSDVIIDASMPAMIRTSGQMWDPDGKLQDTKAVIPDSSYAGVYQAVIDVLQAARRLRSDDHGQRAQRRPDGAEGRGVRLARQDLRDPRATARCASSTRSARR